MSPSGEIHKGQLQRFDKIKGVTPLIEHEIKLEDPTPIKQWYRPRNPAMQEMINQEMDKMLAEGVVQPSTSPWSSPAVITRRKDGKPRFCVDFRRPNSVTKRDAYPLPQVNATLDKLRGSRYFSTIYLKNGTHCLHRLPGGAFLNSTSCHSAYIQRRQHSKGC